MTCNLAYYCLAIALVIYKYKFAVFWRWFIINREKNDTTLHERIILYDFSWCLIELITFTSLICKGVLEFSGFTFYISPSSVDYQFYIEFKSFRSSLDLILLWPRFSDSNCAHFSPHCLSPRLDNCDVELEISLKTKLIMTKTWWTRYELTYLSMIRYQQHLHSQG